ncbi:unnamed protein product, partial [Rotaria sp. Silwood1]
MPKEERLQRCKEFKEFKKRILVATDLIGFHMDFAAVNIVFNYDMSEDADTYLHRVIGAGVVHLVVDAGFVHLVLV